MAKKDKTQDEIDNENLDSAEQESQSKKTNGKEYILDADLKKRGEEVIAKYGMLVSMKPEIGYIIVSPAISKTAIAKCIKASDELNLFSKFHYIIEVSEDIWIKVSDEDKDTILLHELSKICPVYNEKKDDYVMKLVDSDIKGFKSVVKHSDKGLDWYDNIKLQVASVRDLDPAQEDSISL